MEARREKSSVEVAVKGGRRILWGIVIGSALLRLALASGLGVGHDEAYHTLMALHPDWSYYDHPPMMAWVARLGLLAAPGLPMAIAARLGFITLFAGSTWLMARLAARFYGEKAGVIAALVLNATAYYGWAAGSFVLPDGPLLFFWLLTMDRLAVAFRDQTVKSWTWVGLAWGGALLSKYHAVFLPVGAVFYLLVDRPSRRVLLTPGPYVASLIGVVLFLPVLNWNAERGWASFAFQAERAIGDTRLNPIALFGAIGGQAGYLTPWIWAFLMVALYRALRGQAPLDDQERRADRFLLCQSLPPLAAFLAVACQKSVLPHWSLIGLVPVFPLLGRDWADLPQVAWSKTLRRLVVLNLIPVVIAGVFVCQARTGFLQDLSRWTRGRVPVLAAKHDPTVDMMGWDQVAEQLEERGLLDSPGQFVFTSKWYYSGHLAFELGTKAEVLCYDPKGAHAFADWSDPRSAVGRNGLLVTMNASPVEPDMYGRWFQRIDKAAEFDILRAGLPMRHVRVYRCLHQIRPFPEHPPDRVASVVRAETGPPR